MDSTAPALPPVRSVPAWGNVVVAAVLMVATLPGRTQGLGLITEPLLTDLRLDRLTYAHLNLWATLLGATACLPAGWVYDRHGLRWPTAMVLLLLGGVVWCLSKATGSIAALFLLLLLTRTLGQSALSVASITTVGKSFRGNNGLAMGVYAVLLSVFFAVAFVVIGKVVSYAGWRVAWTGVALTLLAGPLPVTLLCLREPQTAEKETGATAAAGLPLRAALREPLFWVFAGATALFGLASSGLGLFNEAVLAERGFGAETFHHFLAATALISLAGQMTCGWLTARISMARLMAVAMALYAAGLLALPRISTPAGLWSVASVVGFSGGMIAVLFFAIWSQAFGRRELGRIQGAAQMLTVLASAIGPLLFAVCQEQFGSYAPALWTLAGCVLAVGLVAWGVKLPGGQPAPEPLPRAAA